MRMTGSALTDIKTAVSRIIESRCLRNRETSAWVFYEAAEASRKVS
jgi:hypothetical protein